MPAKSHSVVREGVVTGLIGGLVVAVWYLIFDAAAGQPLHTPNVLGKIFFRGDLTPGVREIVPRVVAAYMVLHFALFALMGIGLTQLTHLADRDHAMRMGVWIGLVIAFGLFAGLTLMLATATGERLALWRVVGGSLLSTTAMATYLLRRHPRLARSFEDEAMGAEGDAPPHPPAAAH